MQFQKLQGRDSRPGISVGDIINRAINGGNRRGDDPGDRGRGPDNSGNRGPSSQLGQPANTPPPFNRGQGDRSDRDDRGERGNRGNGNNSPGPGNADRDDRDRDNNGRGNEGRGRGNEGRGRGGDDRDD
ncbi:hypothetical protein [Calycomorphotria hydatis]|uniref:hypothetical protein n=1 Tax=Calycomorphotria hydatis TaxID=2528027 RepID=UPI0011A70511|nr:hypothetical protein [Calycomorphotria hydatis]